MPSRLYLGTLMLAFVVLAGGYGYTITHVGNVSAQNPSIDELNALGHEPSWWERLLIEDGPPLAILYILLTVPTWVASVLARSSSWYAGGIIGVVLGLVTGRVLHSLPVTVVGVLVLGCIGALFDHHISRHYEERMTAQIHPRWWAGGRHGVKVWKHFISS